MATKAYTVRQAVEEAAQAHTRLTVFYAVIAMLEGGCLPGGCESANETAEEIIGLCKEEAQTQLETYDAEMAKAIKASAPIPA